MIMYETDISVTTPGIIQFENANEGRSYPFDDNVILSDTEGKTLPENVLADIHMVLPTGSDAYLSSVFITDTLISACLKIMSGSATSAALSVTIRRDDFAPYIPYRLEKLTGFEDIGGIITFGNVQFDDIKGTYRFEDGQVRVTDSAVSRYQPAKLRRIIDDRNGQYVAGDVKINFSQYVTAEQEDDGVGLYLTSGAEEALATKCDKERPVNACGATPVISINGVRPDDQNRIVLWFH